MDYLKLSYALYANYWQKDAHNRILLSYTEFLEKLSQALVQDEESREILMATVDKVTSTENNNSLTDIKF